MKNVVAFLFLLFFVVACQGDKKRFKYEGGEVSFSVSSKPTSWIPCFAFDLNTQIILNQVYESLVEIDQHTYQARPLLAKYFDYSPDFITYTFELNKGIYFHPSPLFPEDSPVELSNQDVIKTFEFACSRKYIESSFAYQNVLKDVKGAEDFHKGLTDKIEGLREEEGKIVIELEKPDPLFLQKLASTSLGVFSSKWIDNQDAVPPGTGPFYLKEENEKEIRLVRHPLYYLKSAEGYSLPYLDEVIFKIYTDDKNKVEDFLSGDLDIINGINASELDHIFESRRADFNKIPPKLVYFNNPLMRTTMILFNLERPLFESSANRKLFNYAIDRNEINRKIIHNQLHESNVYGLIPPMENMFNHYDYDKLKKENLDYNPELVRKNRGQVKDYQGDTLLLNVLDEPQRIALGRILKEQLKKELNVEVRLQTLKMEQMFVSIDKMDADMYLISLSAEFSNPLSLMKHFHGKAVPDSSAVSSTVNLSRYQNWYFDQFFEKATKQFKSTDQFNAILLAEKELLKNPPFIVLFYNSDNYVHYTYVCNFYSNILNLVSFREVYKK